MRSPWVGDGSLSDWGITLADNNNSDWGSGSFTSGDAYSWFREDQNDGAGVGGPLGPLYGGQKYDAEFIGAGLDAGRLVIAVVTGQRPDNDFDMFAPGDVLIETSLGTFGIEVGGGAGGITGGSSVHVAGGASSGLGGSQYTLTSHGYTVDPGGHTSTGQTIGSVWKDGNWVSGLTESGVPKVQIDSSSPGTSAGFAELFYSGNTVTSQHAFFEIALSLTAFNGATINSIQWAPSCGNDLVKVSNLNFPSPAVPSVPEPSTLALVGIGGFGMMFRQWRRKKSATA